MTLPPLLKTGDMIDAAWMNTYVRDNLRLQDTHTHDGGVSEGLAVPTPASITFQQIKSADVEHPAAGRTVMWAGQDSTVKFVAESGNVMTVSDSTHTHAYFGAS